MNIRYAQSGRSAAPAPGRAGGRREWSWTCDPDETRPTATNTGPRPWIGRATDYAMAIAWANLLGS